MASRQRPEKETKRRGKPATTPEARQNQLASLAFDLAEEQIRNGTASSQVITQCLKFGTTREQLEQERLAHENELLQVKREAIQAHQRIEEMYGEAMNAMRGYSGMDPEDEDEFED